MADRAAIERRWLALTRERLPALAEARGWPIRADHCFQRVLLDHAAGGRWYDHIAARPAYAHASVDLLQRAITLGEAVAAGEADLTALDRQSLAWRGKASTPAQAGVHSMPKMAPGRRRNGG